MRKLVKGVKFLSGFVTECLAPQDITLGDLVVKTSLGCYGRDPHQNFTITNRAFCYLMTFQYVKIKERISLEVISVFICVYFFLLIFNSSISTNLQNN